MTVELSDSERRIILRLVDLAWFDENKAREKQEGDSFYMHDLEQIQAKLK